jgi:methylated-DNA-protein-cysteine methyltransferase-like protein
MRSTDYELIWAVVSEIPPGKVATYGQIAAAAGLPGRARLVGRALKNLPENSAVPWQRVLGAGGRISLQDDSAMLQEELLRDEGVQFLKSGRVDLSRCAWEG